MQLKGIDKGKYRSVSRVLAILMSYIPDNGQKSINEISRELDLPLSTASRLVRLLEGQSFLEKDPWSNRYSLGRSVFDLGQAITASLKTRLVAIAKPYINELKDSLGLNVSLEILLGDSTVLAYTAFGSHQHSYGPTVGQRMPVHIAAGAKAILAFSSPEFIDNALSGELVKLTPNTITDAEILKKKLVQFKRNGVAFDFGEGTLDLHSLAAPVFNYEKRPVAAIATGDLAHNINKKFDARIITGVKETAAKISAHLFYNETGEGSE